MDLRKVFTRRTDYRVLRARFLAAAAVGVHRASEVLATAFELVMFIAVVFLAAMTAVSILVMRAADRLTPHWSTDTAIEELFAIALGPFARNVANRVGELEQELKPYSPSPQPVEPFRVSESGADGGLHLVGAGEQETVS